ncbi:hypothetical protein F5876DRAFT_68201 [Lentinula aff. lateritia]|uniref:Uncharacterized protein n=1 Tax=Lentinula aff. lateritia TaxID=2804960 RepID=A0ACC1TS59_9AGAR|nr:hypothetical protein F5876DRAFT_68201 [Lentinula aff. lateritia]
MFFSVVLLLPLVISTCWLVAARTIPHGQPRGVLPDGNSRTSAIINLPRATFVEVKSLERRILSRKDWETEWFRQLGQPWINFDETKPWESQCYGYDQNQEVFKDDLTAKVARRTPVSGAKGGNNQGIFTLQDSYPIDSRMIAAASLIVKFVDFKQPMSSCEVFALRKFNLILEAGHTTVDGNKIGVIVMNRMSGEPLQETDVWKSASREHKAKICQKLAEYLLNLTYKLVTQGFLHAPSNILVKFTSINGQDPLLATVYIVDWGHPGIYTTILKSLPDQKSYSAWFFKRWVFLWQSINNALHAGKDAASKGGASTKGHEGKNQRRSLSLVEFQINPSILFATSVEYYLKHQSISFWIREGEKRVPHPSKNGLGVRKKAIYVRLLVQPRREVDMG